MNKLEMEELAGIQYLGLPGITQSCKEAIMRLLQSRANITKAKILTFSPPNVESKAHCFLLAIDNLDHMAIKSGFSSGYPGEGPSGFSYVLQLLKLHGVEIEEYEINKEFQERLDQSALTQSDIESLDQANSIRGPYWRDYISERHANSAESGKLLEEFLPIIPFAIVDSRIMDLALSFWNGPNDKLRTGYSRLEDVVRRRTASKESAGKLFSIAFQGPNSLLTWNVKDSGEQVGRASLFTAAYSAHRNPRAHREIEDDPSGQLNEFLLLNYLFTLEGEAVLRDEIEEDGG
jgi:hypothetical protein